MPDTQTQAHREWLQQAVRKSGLKPAALARRAGLSTTTLTRPHNDPEWSGTLSTRTIAAVAAAAGIKPPGPAAHVVHGFEESDVEPLDTTAPRQRAGSNSRDMWVINTRVLDLAGFIPGDELLVDLNTSPRDGDAVIAQVLDRSGEAETVLRIYDAPYLTARCLHPPKPVLVDGDRVSIMGVVTESRRCRLAG